MRQKTLILSKSNNSATALIHRWVNVLFANKIWFMLSPLGWDRFGAEWLWCTKRSQVVNCLHLEFHPSARPLLVCYPASYFYPVPLSSFACVVCACVLCIVYCVYCVFASYHQSDVQSSINPSHPSTLTSWVHKAQKHYMLLLPFSTTGLD